MEPDAYFLDSYALIEIIRGNPQYQKFLHSSVITTQLNLFEVAYALLREGIPDVYPIISRYASCIVGFQTDLIVAAASFRLCYKKKNLSMVDCIGYCLAKNFHIPFVTGDMQFRDMENVHFLPKS